MTLRDRLIRLCDEGRLVELYFNPNNNYYLARITRVGQDYVEFDAHDEDHQTVIAHNIFPLSLLMGITTDSLEQTRERLENIYQRDSE